MQSQVFSISHTDNMILARIDGRDEAYSNYIRNYIQKNFRFFIHLRESILVFPKSEDRTKRKFFLDCLLNNLNKTNQNKTNIDFNLSVPFFVEFANSKEGSMIPKVIVKCHRENVFFRFSEETKRVVDFLRKNFFGMKVDVDYFQKVAKIPIKNKEEYSLLRKLLSKKIKFNDFMHVRFAYNEEELIRLHSNTKSTGRKTFYDSCSPDMEMVYLRELNCYIDDSFDTVRQKYLELIKIYHPDRVYGKDEETVRRYTEKFRRVQNAFEGLKKTRFAMAS